ncbi:hypothetical protein C8R47DRAFT_1231268 [Mycena vitilis]|nr:hypothetical protein C8R47DRAFT_1231268 [Mycena vitilis]
MPATTNPDHPTHGDSIEPVPLERNEELALMRSEGWNQQIAEVGNAPADLVPKYNYHAHQNQCHLAWRSLNDHVTWGEGVETGWELTKDAIQVLLDLEAPRLSPIQPTASKPPPKARSFPSTRPRTSKPSSPSPSKAVSSATSSLKRKLSTGRSSVLDEGFQEGRRDSKRPKLTRKPEDGEVILVEDSDEEIDELSDLEEKA